MNAKTIKIAVTAPVLVAALVRADVHDPERGHRVLQARGRGDGRAGAWHGKNCTCTATSSRSILQKPDTLEYRFQVQNNGKVVASALHRHRARHVQGRVRGRAQGASERERFQGRAARRDGQVPVEVRSADPAVTTPASSRADIGHARTRHVHPAGRLRHVRLRVCGLGRGRPPAFAAAGRERHRRLLPRRGADGRRVGGPDPRVRHRQLRDQVRPALLGRGAAAGLQDRLVLGRARRLDHVLGVPARRSSDRSRST